METSGLRPIVEEEAASPDWRTVDSAKLVPQSPVPRTFVETRDVWEKRGDSISWTMTVLKQPAYSATEVQETVEKPKRTPSLVSRFSKGKFTVDDFSSFTGKGAGLTSGLGGGSGMPGGGPGGPLGGGGGDPDGGYSSGQVPRFRTFGQDAKPLAVGALRLEAPPRYRGFFFR